MRREFRRTASTEVGIKATLESWRLSFSHSLHSAERHQPSKNDLRKALADAAHNTAEMQKADQ